MDFSDVEFMKIAIAEAKLSLVSDDVPVGAVIVRDGEIISSAHNMREADGCATAHAEVKAIEAACRKLGRWRLSDCVMYVTIEPCIMCAGAIINARIGKVIFGARNPKAGACVSVIDVNAHSLGAKVEFTSGVCEEECGELISEFFKKKRTVE